MNLEQYIASINKRFKQGNATEHTFRGDLQQLIETILPGISATNEPKRQKCGAPDYILLKKDIPLGYIEAKNIGEKDLEGTKKAGNKEQFDRYKASLNNLFFTDYIDFHLYRDGEFVTKVAIAYIENNSLVPVPENFETFTNLMKDFGVYVGQTIKSSKKLAQMMAGKARLLSDVIEKSVSNDESKQEDSTLKEQMDAFKEILIHDITPKGFADVYSQTIAYGMFAARLHDPTLPTFSRQEAAELIPKSNPFLRKLFSYIAGPDIDDRIKWIVDSLVEIFLACNVEELLRNYGKTTKMEDPIIHFYETFLSEYDPKLRKARGVWYTPQPVVNFIVRAVDDVLKMEFELGEGLRDNSKTKIKMNLQKTDKRFTNNIKTIEEEVHRVQILDPATGTGTFLAEIVKQIYANFKGQQGIWSNYVETHLLPRLNGFELLMASYAMAHLQLDLLLTETGFKAKKEQRFRVYLTNSLEEYHKDTGLLFANWLSTEANEANRIKRDTPVMVVIGNPPYFGESANKGKWIMKLMEDYKKEPGGKEKLKERNPKWLNDDYVKFLRYGQHFIEKNGSGILAFINPHGFLDNPTFRGMRWNLLKAYDKIYTIDLHGNSKKQETATDGSADQNVFDIMQGVSINIFVKTGKKKQNELGKVLHHDLYGKRDFKYEFLQKQSLASIDFTMIPNKAPMYYWVPKNFNLEKEYERGFQVNQLFLDNNMGITSGDDGEYIDFSRDVLVDRFTNTFIREIEYRPFDKRYINYNDNLLARGRFKFMQNFLQSNFAISLVRRSRGNVFVLPFITSGIVDKCIISTLDNANIFPLYRYTDIENQPSLSGLNKKTPNLNEAIIERLADLINAPFLADDGNNESVFTPVDILDYIYAVLYSPSYREKYNEFLKLDFPRIPYPKDAKIFWKLARLGQRLRETHLLKNSSSLPIATQYPIDGSNEVIKVTYNKGKLYINKEQYFDLVAEDIWETYIGGFQPAQKWLKDRKGQLLTYDDIRHYQILIGALTETQRIMCEIDMIDIA